MDLRDLQPPQVLFQSGYGALKASESLLFTLSPVPLGAVKAGIQEVGIPLALTALATQDPMFGDALTHAVGTGGDVLSAVVTQGVADGLNQLGSSIGSNLPQGFGIQTAANGMGQAIEVTTLAATAATAKFSGAIATGLAIGRGAIKAAQAMTQVPIQQVIRNGQQAIAKTKAWLAATAKDIQQKFGVSKMSENNGHHQQTKAQRIANQVAFEQKFEQATAGLEQGQTLPPLPPLPPPPPPPLKQSGADPEKQQTAVAEPVANRSEPGQSTPQPALTEVEAQIKTPMDTEADNTQPTTSDGDEIDPEQVARELATTLAMRGIDTQHFKILVDGSEAFKMGGGDITSNTLDPDAAKMLKQALEDPASLKGSVKIVQGGKTLLHVSDGKIIADTLGIAKEAAKVQVEKATAGLALYEKAAADVKMPGLQGAQQIAANALKLGAKTEQVQEMLLNHSDAIKGIEPAEQAKAAERVITGAEKLAKGIEKTTAASHAPAIKR